MRTTMRAEPTIPERRRRRPVPVGLRLAAEAARATTEFGALVAALPSLRRAPRGDGHPVLVIPGLAAGDATTVVLRQFLRDRGYDARGWGLGVNLGPIASIRTDLRDTLEALADRHDRGVSLVGWSLGGVYALELGRRSPISFGGSSRSAAPSGGSPWARRRRHRCGAAATPSFTGGARRCRPGRAGRTSRSAGAIWGWVTTGRR